MAARIHHRGPDGGGVAADDAAAIGMKRLAIVDVEGGIQPMSSDDGSVVLVYNGEIYNAPALRRELAARGVRFDTRSDTEVILRLYELDPEHVEERLVGMWAFAIHDRRRRRLVLSRDRFGIKPFFVARRGRTIAFASELCAFSRSSPLLEGLFELDRGAARAMLAWGYVPEDASIFRGIERLSPAHRLEVDLDTGAERRRCYWRLSPSAEAARVRGMDEACELVDVALGRAVKEHLESDVPIATFLSGGIDSSLVTAYAAKGASVAAFSIGFREPRFDESPFARATAERIGVPLSVTILDEDTVRDSVGDALCAYDEPFGDSSSLATFLLSREVAKTYKVALGGDGGDEAFAGYEKYRLLPVRKVVDRVPFARHAMAKALSMLPESVDRTSLRANLLRVASKVRRGLADDAGEAYVAMTQMVPLALTAPLVDGEVDVDRFVADARRRFEGAAGTLLQRTLAADAGGPLPNDMLTKVDRASMACSLEARVPFLDHRVVDLGVGLPERLTLGRGGKAVLRELHRRRFGRALAERRKQGFGVPVERWLKTSLAGAATELFRRERIERYGVLSASALADGRHREWLVRQPLMVWHAFALAAWCEVHLGDGPDAVRSLVKR